MEGQARAGSSGEIQVEEFPHFEVISGESAFSDHYYVPNKTSLSNSASRTIAQEWKMLQEGLPESIYVRTYEERMDLLRAVIIGSRGTPYHDGLFFFDISLPSDYPKNPPRVYYHSHGMRLNPNLYGNGYVCLSLINTWGGNGVELWRPGQSTILQVLVSIQGLVLNDRPYFNEPGAGFLSTVENNPALEKLWMNYNKVVFLYSCKTVLCKILNPPKGFEVFVGQHFRARAEFVLSALRAYADGECAIGLYDGSGSGSGSGVEVSSAQKAALLKIHADFQAGMLGVLESSSLDIPAGDDGPPPPLIEEEGPLESSEDGEEEAAVEHKKPQKKVKGSFFGKMIQMIKCAFF